MSVPQHFPHPLHLLEDLLSSLSSDATLTTTATSATVIPSFVVDHRLALADDGDGDGDGDASNAPAVNAAEARQDDILCAADALLGIMGDGGDGGGGGGVGTSGALLEYSLALLDEQARCH